MIERREDLSFALEARETFGIGRDRRRQHLDRDVTMEVGVAGAIDLTHPPGSNGRDDLIGADARASGKSQAWMIIRFRPRFPPPSPQYRAVRT